MKFSTKEEHKNHQYYCGGPSKTVPDQSVSVKEILQNYASGAYSQYYNIGTYDDQVTFDDYCPEDFKDIAELEFACVNSAPVREAYKRALERENKAKEQQSEQNPLNDLQNETKSEIKV